MNQRSRTSCTIAMNLEAGEVFTSLSSASVWQHLPAALGCLTSIILFLFGGIVVARSQTVSIPTNVAPRWFPLKDMLKKWAETPVEAITQKAESGDLTAQHYLGYCYAEGFRFPQNSTLGIRWYQRAGNSGYLPSFNNLGFLYEQGKGVPQDFSRALQYYRLAADSGFPKAYARIGILYRDGLGSQKNPEEAAKWFQLAADKGDSFGQFNLGLLYEEKGDLPRALRLLRKAAEQGQTEAMVRMYFFLWQGKGMPLDHAEAMRWLTQAANDGNAYAQCLLGYHYKYPEWEGSGPNRHLPRSDLPEAVRWFRLSADQNWAGGQYYLALAYLGGEATQKDEALGLEMMRKAADQNHSDALCELASLYSRDMGEPRNEQDRPIHLLLRAASQDNADAYARLAFRYRHGLGIERDLIEASRWDCRAAFGEYSSSGRGDPLLVKSAGKSQPTDPFLAALSLYTEATRQNPQAMAKIGSFYLTGQNAPKSLTKAWLWFQLARERGGDTSQDVSQIEAQMNAEQLKDARLLLAPAQKELAQVGVEVRALSEVKE